MQDLYLAAFARHNRAVSKRREFARAWGKYIDVHPWDIDVRNVDPSTLEILAVTREPAPAELALIFSEWLAALRAALDNGLYALAAATSGQNPPPQAERLQYPVCSTPEEFKKQAKRLTSLPEHVIEALEKSQPYQSPYGPESNLTYWIHELARKDRHRTLHVGLGRVDEHRIRVAAPPGVEIEFDTSVKPYSQIEGELVVARLTANRPIHPHEIKADLRGVAIAPEIQAWAGFTLNGASQTLQDRMIYTEIFVRNHLENMAVMGAAVPPDGFKTFDPSQPADGAA
ncbi:hypothetical protein [Microbacterium foliorum]|uniref:hypothetical protein n=1 Tax=Microbacterium foliorum TaxID=104336 RepID=UPI001DDF1765|nr:hypothetical protein [Microbacterium foliorum]CAH0183418.1 hypothetical protein SRABI44_01505 [Microbacterium foliorum]CAH0216724.1 hypothetical protein SRABI03_02366 [Microbacterium foliorum]